MNPFFSPCGVITLTTDFGHKGPYVATMKGVMLGRFPEVRVIDLTHEIVVHWPAEAGFWLQRSFHFFPRGTVHVAVVDPGVGTERDIIAGVFEGHAFLAPDNGLLAPILGDPKTAQVHRLDQARLSRFGIEKRSVTFDGRDVFAPLAAELAAGRCRPDDLGDRIKDLVPSWVEDPESSLERVSGVVISVDNFGNLITNIDQRLIAHFTRAVARAGGREFALARTYGNVTPGEPLALINSFGVLELARAEQSAASWLGVGRGAPVTVSEKGQ